MLHIATVHYRSPRWIEVQTRALREHISVPYQTWASLEGIDRSYAVHFDRVVDLGRGHAGQLNSLALEISRDADDSDLLMFLDGDAFPIRDPMPLISDGLARAPLIAVKRAENGGDQQPHPCFCVTTVGTWHEIHGDWSEGYQWVTPDGRRMTDVGGNLLRLLELNETSWVEVLRTSHSKLDPVFFGVYGDAIYHHGAGFRRGTSRGIDASRPKPLPTARIPVLRALVYPVERARRLVWKLKNRRPQILESKRIFEKIQRGDPDWLAYISS